MGDYLPSPGGYTRRTCSQGPPSASALNPQVVIVVACADCDNATSMNRIRVLISSTILYTLLPAVLFAQDDAAKPLSAVQKIVSALGGIVSGLIPVAFALALLFFFWGLALYILNAGNEEKKSEGRRVMIGGVIALFIMASIWGIVSFIGGALGIGQGGKIKPPDVLMPSESGPGVDF